MSRHAIYLPEAQRNATFWRQKAWATTTTNCDDEFKAHFQLDCIRLRIIRNYHSCCNLFAHFGCVHTHIRHTHELRSVLFAEQLLQELINTRLPFVLRAAIVVLRNIAHSLRNIRQVNRNYTTAQQHNTHSTVSRTIGISKLANVCVCTLWRHAYVIIAFAALCRRINPTTEVHWWPCCVRFWRQTMRGRQ